MEKLLPEIFRGTALLGVLAFVFYTSASAHRFWQSFYKYVPNILLCFFIPGLFSTFGWLRASDTYLDELASQALLPACLVLLLLSVDFASLRQLGPKALGVFLAGALGIMVGGPLAIWTVKSISPSTMSGIGADQAWRGLATIAGSWIGGNANQLALREIFEPSESRFAQASVIDVMMSELWLALLLFGIGKNYLINKALNANDNEIERLKTQMAHRQAQNPHEPISLPNLIFILFVGFSVTALAHACAGQIVPFIKANAPWLKRFSLTSNGFWVIMIATTTGLLLSQTRLRKLEQAGASRVGTLFLYFLITTIGLQMNLLDAFRNPMLFVVGAIWILTHAVFTLVAAKWLKAPYFFVAVGSQANVGGVASASVVAGAFHPSLTPIGVMLAIFGNAIGTYLGLLTGLAMQWVYGF
jgi:uncharacterized membrane protein